MFPSLADEHAKITARYADELAQDVSDIVQRFPAVKLRLPITFYDIMQFVVDCYESVDDVEVDAREEFKNAVDAFDERASKLFDSGELSAVARRIEASDDANHITVLNESFKPDPDIDIAFARGMLKVSGDMLRSRTKAIQGFRKFGIERSKVVAWYVQLQEEGLPAFRRRETVYREILCRIDSEASHG